jgi:hypothetical protein
MQLVDRYQPDTIDGFVGLDFPRRILSAFAARPYQAAFFLLGPSGTGKTTLSLALAKEIGAELHHVPSQNCDVETMEKIIARCHYAPMFSTGGWHVVLVDEADRMSKAAQLFLLSKLDATAWPPQTIFVFTANETTLLEDRFLSRCKVIQFDADALLQPGCALLRKIWNREHRPSAKRPDIISRIGRRKSAPPEPPDFAAILRHSHCNIREALQILETELLAPGSFKTIEPAAAAVVTRAPDIYTLGLARLKQADLEEAITTLRIAKVVDVRPVPRGGRFPKEVLETLLDGKYRWSGDSLGERPTDAGFKSLLTAPTPTLILCREEPPGNCHRHNKIATALHTRGIECAHIFQEELVRASDLDKFLRGRTTEYPFSSWKVA